MFDFKHYPRRGHIEARPYAEGEILPEHVSISAADREAGSPKLGDMIARNPDNPDDQWLIAAAYFAANYGVSAGDA
jgi:hypothetical protein